MEGAAEGAGAAGADEAVVLFAEVAGALAAANHVCTPL